MAQFETKFDIIEALKNDEVFDLTQEIIDTIKADEDESHHAVNENILDLVSRIHEMSSWMAFDWKTLLDLSSQAFGFHKYLTYSDIGVADVAFQLEDLHNILWGKYAHIPEN